MPVEVIMPRVDMDMTQGRIAKWHVRNGQSVRKGQPIFDIETDKAAMEIEAPADGTVGDIAAAEGASIPVGAAVAFIYETGEAPKVSTSSNVSSPGLSRGPIPSIEAGVHNGSAPKLSTERMGPRHKAGDDSSVETDGAVRATPLARRLARQSEIALEGIIGSGPRGRILAEDIRKALASAKPVAPPNQDIIPLAAMRRTIAERLVHAKQTIPHFYLSLACDMGELLAIRERLAKTRKLSINDFIVKALALALQRVPKVNVTWNTDSIVQHGASDIAVAVAVEDGLFTPVIRSAETKSLSRISDEMKDLATRARAKKLAPSEYQGGSTTISNLGMHGIEEFTAIVNPPHATILAVGAIVEEPAKHEGAIVLRPRMKCTLSCDHRAIDGALGAQLLASFKSFIEDPALMLL